MDQTVFQLLWLLAIKSKTSSGLMLQKFLFTIAIFVIQIMNYCDHAPLLIYPTKTLEI